MDCAGQAKRRPTHYGPFNSRRFERSLLHNGGFSDLEITNLPHKSDGFTNLDGFNERYNILFKYYIVIIQIIKNRILHDKHIKISKKKNQIKTHAFYNALGLSPCIGLHRQVLTPKQATEFSI